MAGPRTMRLKSTPAAITAGPYPVRVPLKPQAVAQPPRAPSQPTKGSEASKKRKISEFEQPDTKPQQQAKKLRRPDAPAPEKEEPQQQAKKPRRPEASALEKEEPRPQKQVNGHKPPKDEAPVPFLKKKPIKQDLPAKKDTASQKSATTAYRVSKSWPNGVGKQKIKGLSNPGNWCYRRSVLQSLIAVPQLFNLLEDSHKSCPKQGKCVTCALRQLLRSYHTTPGGVGRDLGALDSTIRATGKTSEPRWRAAGQTQEDSHEFLQYLLGTVENAKGVQKEQFGSVFQIKHKISWSCSNCGKSHVRSDPPGLSLNLPIPKQSGTVNITACLDTYHREPNVTIRCDKCKKNARRTRTFQIEDAPEVLPIQLMRFGFSGYGPTKNKQHVEFPEDLDLTNWALDKSKPLKYRLQAVVAHSGTLKFGHYIAYVRGADGIKDISDSDVSNTNAKEWRRPTNGFNPYILVYIKQ